MTTQEPEQYLKTAEVARILHVSPKSVTRWAATGRLPHSRTLGGHRRFPQSAIEEIANGLVVPWPGGSGIPDWR